MDNFRLYGSPLQHCPTIGQFDRALKDLWTDGHSTVQPLDSWTKHIPTIGLLDTQLTSHRTVGHSIDRQLDCLTKHCPTIGQFDRALSDILTIGHSTVQSLMIMGEGAQCVTNYDSDQKSLSRQGGTDRAAVVAVAVKRVGYNLRLGEVSLPMRLIRLSWFLAES